MNNDYYSIRKPNLTDYTHTDSDMRIYRHECHVLSRHLVAELNKALPDLMRNDRIPHIIAGIFNSTSHWRTLPDHLMYALKLYLQVNAYQFAKSLSPKSYQDYAVTYQTYKKQYYEWIETIRLAY